MAPKWRSCRESLGAREINAPGRAAFVSRVLLLSTGESAVNIAYHSRYLHLVASTLLVFNLGCGERGPQRYHVSGTVTYKGEPVAFGSIVFQPDQSRGNSGPYGAASIKDGKFDTQIDGHGPIGGPHLVMIEAFDGKNINEDYAPYGNSIGSTYQRPFDLPSENSTLEIELTDR